MSPSKPAWVWLQHRVDIPSWLAIGIGQIASEWSDLEWQFEDAIRMLLQTDVKRGRIVTTGMNMRGRIACLISLMHAVQIDDHLIDSTITIGTCITERLEGERNKIIHGLWSKVGRDWNLLISAGTRKHPVQGRRKFRRSVLPERETATSQSLAEIRERIRDMRQQMENLRQQIEAALPPSPHKSPSQHQHHRPTRARKKPTPSTPH
jgi:hypothetical protein